MTQFDRPLTGFRFVSIEQDDTLQKLALRELGDASQWAQLVAINGLTPPYLTGDATLASATVKLYGQLLIVPAPVAQVSAATDPNDVFKTDLLLLDGNLVGQSGDFATVSGRDNLVQALENVLATEPTELMFHPTYGNLARRLIGQGNGPTTGLLATQFVKAAVAADERISSVKNASASIQGNDIAVDLTAVTVSGGPISIPKTGG